MLDDGAGIEKGWKMGIFSLKPIESAFFCLNVYVKRMHYFRRADALLQPELFDIFCTKHKYSVTWTWCKVCLNFFVNPNQVGDAITIADLCILECMSFTLSDLWWSWATEPEPFVNAGIKI